MTVSEQERALRAEAEGRGLDVAGVYVDNGVSAFKKVNRPGWADLVAAIETGEVTHVLTVALDRATRRVADMAMIREAAEEADCVIVADGREYHPADDALALYLGGIVAEQESRDKSRRVRAAKQEALERGLYNGGRRPFGFRKVDGAARGYWEQDPDEAAAILQGAAMVRDGASLKRIAETWNAAGLKTSSASNPWTAAKVRRALLSPIVAGLRTHDGEIAGDLMLPDGQPWPAILTPQDRREIEAVLATRFGRHQRRWHTPNPGLLSGVAVCGRCDHNLTPRRYGGRRPDAYTCQSDGGGRCGGVGVSMPKLDELVTAAALDALDSSAFWKALRQPHKRQDPDAENVDVLVSELDELAEASGRGEIPIREYLVARKPLERRLKAARAALESDAASDALQPFEDADTVSEVWERLDLDHRRAVLAALFERVEIAPANGARIFDPARVELVWRV